MMMNEAMIVNAVGMAIFMFAVAMTVYTKVYDS